MRSHFRRQWIQTSLALLSLSMVVRADDWANWRGPRHNGVSTEQDCLRHWPEMGLPKVVWRAAVGKGHSAISISRGRAFTLGWDGEQDTVYCFDATTGELKWRQSYPCKTIVQWPGPRATPTVADGIVYTLGQWGQLHAWDAAIGAKRWGVTLPAGYNPDVDYGFAWSPLVLGDLLILSAGSKGLAIRRSDGSFAWGHDGQHGACASAVPFRFSGVSGVAVVSTDPGRNSVRMVGVEPATGRELWRSPPWEEKWGAACVDLLVSDDKVFITTAEQHPRCSRFSLKDGKLSEDWSNRNFAGYTGGCVLIDGHVYGVDKLGILKCLDWNTGAVRWHTRGFGRFGTLTAADGTLIVQHSDGGNLSAVAATPDKFQLQRRGKVFTRDEATLTAPVLANGRIYCRSYAGEVVCLDVRLLKRAHEKGVSFFD